MPLDPARIAEVQGWLKMAQLDFRAAEADWNAIPPLLEDIAFHRQRGAEKSFKAFPAWHGVQFGKTHDLGKLGILAIGIDSALEPFARSAAPLTAYAVLTRYPSEGFSVSDRAAREAENLARKVFSGLPGSVWVEHPPWDPGGTGTRERPDPSSGGKSLEMRVWKKTGRKITAETQFILLLSLEILVSHGSPAPGRPLRPAKRIPEAPGTHTKSRSPVFSSILERLPSEIRP